MVRFCLPMQRIRFDPWLGVKISHVLWPKNKNLKQKQYCNKKFNKDLKKRSTPKKKKKKKE